MRSRARNWSWHTPRTSMPRIMNSAMSQQPESLRTGDLATRHGVRVERHFGPSVACWRCTLSSYGMCAASTSLPRTLMRPASVWPSTICSSPLHSLSPLVCNRRRSFDAGFHQVMNLMASPRPARTRAAGLLHRRLDRDGSHAGPGVRESLLHRARPGGNDCGYVVSYERVRGLGERAWSVWRTHTALSITEPCARYRLFVAAFSLG